MKKIIALLMIAFSFLGVNAQTSPAFPGGETALQTYITENLQYPASAKENGIEGVVSVTFTVKADGSIGNIKIKRMVDPDLEAEAIRLVKGMPKWTPSDGGEAQAEVDIPFTL
ncbi:MAG: energy transducer TonB [Muribaculaceae bacterium]|nr:energy transducer TonB [Muribaculaceae bacterium]